VFGFADYSALELSTLAQVCYTLLGASQMREAINSGRDLHSALAADLTGKTYEQVKEAVKAGERWAEDARYAAKAANFGFPGGMGSAKFVLAKRKEGLRLCCSMQRAKECGISKTTEYKGRPTSPTCIACLEAAEDLRKAWFNAWPEMTDYFAMVSRETENGSGAISQLVSRRIRGNCGFTDGANTRFQGLAADGAKHALFLLTRECYEFQASVLFGSRPVLFIHDEIGSELREPCASDALKRVIEVGIQGMKVFTPDVDINMEGYLCRHWYKGGKDLKINGKSVPVKPDENGKWVHDDA
jgi:DNA polymerase I-like protein with 3'-5' exonuclease and polymerase domains